MNFFPTNLPALLALSFDEESSLGFSDGKMGGSVYFFHLSRTCHHPPYKKIAEKLLDQVFNNIHSVEKLDLRDGLTGIGMAIHYLIHNKYVQGNENIILRNIDDTLFKNRIFGIAHSNINIEIDTHILLYLCIRFQALEKIPEQHYLFQELAAEVINESYNKIDLNFFNEPVVFKIDHVLPLYIYVLSKIAKTGFYKQRIEKILNEISPNILNRIPCLDSNKLHLMAVLHYASQILPLEGWARHAQLLKREINFNHILSQEIQSWNIFIKNGFSGIKLLIDNSTEIFSSQEISTLKQRINQKIENSETMKHIWTPENIKPYNGLLNGFPSVVFVQDNLLKL